VAVQAVAEVAVQAVAEVAVPVQVPA